MKEMKKTWVQFYIIYHPLNILYVPLGIFLIVVVLLGLLRVCKADFSLFLLAASFLCVSWTGYVILAFAGRTPAGWGGYKSYKLLSFFLPQVLLSSLLLFRNVELQMKHRVYVLLLLMFLGGNTYTCYKMVKHMVKSHRTVNRDLADLKKLEQNPLVASLNILGSDTWNILWPVNFLLRKKLYFETTSYAGRVASSLDGQWDLKRESGTADDMPHISGFDNCAETLPVNSSYILQKANGTVLKARLGIGWYGSEITYRWTGGDLNLSRIILQSALDQLAVSFRAEYWPLNQNNHLSIYLNGEKIVDCPNNSFCKVESVMLSQGENILELRPAIPPEFPGNGDPRRLSYAFRSIEISPPPRLPH